MSLIKILLIVGMLGTAYHYWKKPPRVTPAPSAAVQPGQSTGFVSLPPVNGAPSNTVMVVAAENCPHEDAQRADRLAAELKGRGIPVQRSHQVSFTIDSPDSAVPERINAVMNGQLPIVFVNGRAKPNPSLEDVIAEFKNGGR